MSNAINRDKTTIPKYTAESTIIDHNEPAPNMLQGIILLFVLDRKEDVGILTENLVVDLLFDRRGLARESHVLELNLALSKLVIASNIIIHNLAGKLHVVESFNVPDKGLTVDGIGLILLLGRLLVTHILVKDGIILFKFKLHIGVALYSVIWNDI